MKRKGAGKGQQFERTVCKTLSHWVSKGKREDLFWRSAMSGGRATVSRKRGGNVRQAGDIVAVAAEGHQLTDRYYIECKHYADLDIDAFFYNGKGKLGTFWRKAVQEANSYGRIPMLIAKQNNYPVIVLMTHIVENRALVNRAIWFSQRRNCFVFKLKALTRGGFDL